MQDPYAVLGVDRNASLSDIKGVQNTGYEKPSGQGG